MCLIYFRKWKCGKASCIVVSDDGQTIVTALKEIKWWDVSGEKEKLLKTFIGQSTDIFSLTFVRINDEPCVLSAASGNRLIHAWYITNSLIYCDSVYSLILVIHFCN